MIGDEFLTEERDRKYYADHYTCCPPPLFIILITLVEVSTGIGYIRFIYTSIHFTQVKESDRELGVSLIKFPSYIPYALRK